MKKLQLCAVISIALLTACSMGEHSENHKQDKLPVEINLKTTGDLPENRANPFDKTGQLYGELTEQYITNDSEVTTIANTVAQVEMLAAGNTGFIGLQQSFYTVPSPSRISYLISEQSGRTAEIIALSPLSWKGKISLSNYLNSLLWYAKQKAGFEEIYNFSIEYEASVINDTEFTETDRKIILTIASVSRYGYHMQKKKKIKRRDRDWEISMGNFLTAGEGINMGAAEAVTMSVVAGITINR